MLLCNEFYCNSNHMAIKNESNSIKKTALATSLFIYSVIYQFIKSFQYIHQTSKNNMNSQNYYITYVANESKNI